MHSCQRCNTRRSEVSFTSAGLVPDLVPQFNPDVALKASSNGKQVQLGNTFNTLRKPTSLPPVSSLLTKTRNLD